MTGQALKHCTVFCRETAPLDFREANGIPQKGPALPDMAPQASSSHAGPPAGTGPLGVLLYSFREELATMHEGWQYITSSSNRCAPCSG